MSDFDPYHIWLGIPLTDRPISKYRLLGIDAFEHNRDVISAAAERQTIYLRTLQAGEHAVLVADLLNEVSQARVCLLDGKSKSRYDTQLRSDLEPAPEQDPLAFAAEELAAVVSKPATRSRPRSGGGTPFWKQPWAIPAAGGGVVVLLLLMWLFGDDESKPAQKQQGPATAKVERKPNLPNKKPERARLAAAEKSAIEKAATETVVTLKGHSSSVRAVAFSPDGKQIVSGGGDNRVKLWDIKTEQVIHTFKGHSDNVNSVAFSPDGKWIVSGSKDRLLKVWNTENGEEITSLKGHSDTVRSVAFSPDGKRIVSGSYDKTMRVWDVETGQQVRTLGNLAGVNSVAFSPDGKRIVSGSHDHTVKVWDAETGREILTFSGHSRPVHSAAFSPDEKAIVSGGEDRQIKVFDAVTGAQTVSITEHTTWVSSVAFSPDSKQIVSTDYDNALRVWDAQTGQEMVTLKGHEYGINSVAFSPDGKRIVSGGQDGTIKIWDLGSEPAAANTLPASLQEGLIAYYPFNGNANDESGNGHHITDRQVTIVKKGRAMISEGGSFEVTIPGLPSANMPRTLALTLVPTDRGKNARMVCYWGTPGALSCFGVSYWKGDAHRWFAYPTDAKVACALSQETQLVLACDGVKVKFYKNGVLVNDEELTLKTAAGDRFYIGSKTNHHSEFEGTLDDIRIYDRALSAAEVKALYDFEKP